MAWDNWVIDATMGYPFCFCPVEGDLHGEFSVVTGMNMLGGPPADAKVVAIVHEDGPEATNAFYKKHQAEIDALFLSPQATVMAEKWFVEIRPFSENETDDGFRRMEAWNERDAMRIDRGANINLNHRDYYTRIIPPAAIVQESADG